MSKQLPARPSLEQYRKQAKDLLKAHSASDHTALERIRQHHPTLHKLPLDAISSAPFSLTDAQLVLAREHNFESWPKFAAHIETLTLIRTLAELKDPVAAFIEVACVPRHSGHTSGTLEHAELILSRYPQVATANIHTAAILADDATVKRLLLQYPQDATTQGGPHQWDALTHLCFSRYLRLDKSRSEAFVRTAKLLLDAGASARTGWYEMIDHPTPRPCFESAIYGAAGIAQHAALTRLLLDFGADPNDEETPYHVPEGYNNTVMEIIVESGRLNQDSFTTLLVRKSDWHDFEGIRYLLEHGAGCNHPSHWKNAPFQHAVLRDNSIEIIQLFLDHGADPLLRNRDDISAVTLAIRRGRGDILDLFHQRSISIALEPLDQLIAACAQDNGETIQALTTGNPGLVPQLLADGGVLLNHFAANGNTNGARNLLDLGIDPSSLSPPGDGYFGIAKNSTALHAAAWRANPSTVKLLIAREAPINALDGQGRTALQLAIKATVDSYWTELRTTESIEALLKAGATTQNIQLPTGYPEADALLLQYQTSG
ncbi:MAG TPA: ankyrin repeat domain-containing protein [Edaphobacter sp.]